MAFRFGRVIGLGAKGGIFCEPRSKVKVKNSQKCAFSWPLFVTGVNTGRIRQGQVGYFW